MQYKFHAQLKDVRRLALVSNDTQYSVKLITNQLPAELMNVQADELVDVEINVREA